jgi:hypothetical protein
MRASAVPLWPHRRTSLPRVPKAHNVVVGADTRDCLGGSSSAKTMIKGRQGSETMAARRLSKNVYNPVSLS